ncbi:helix-turn-helix domain-containing protein [Polaribacter reichenbachii]|nr:helix-turn-helix domain-containing protein [Polaribacter reichenbachii]
MLLNNEHFKLVKNWTIYFYVIHILSSLTVLISLYIEIKNGSLPSGKSMAIFLLLFWLFIFFKILISPEILYGLPILNKTLLRFNNSLLENTEILKPRTDNWLLVTKDKKSNQDQKLQEKITKNISSYILEVDKLSTEELIFRNQKASQNTIAEKLGVPTSHIVYLFKYHSKISFSEYRMNSRIQDAIHLINQNFLNNETFESLAYTTGFSSYNPFFSAFKKITTYSPQDYIKVNKI